MVMVFTGPNGVRLESWNAVVHTLLKSSGEFRGVHIRTHHPMDSAVAENLALEHSGRLVLIDSLALFSGGAPRLAQVLESAATARQAYPDSLRIVFTAPVEAEEKDRRDFDIAGVELWDLTLLFRRFSAPILRMIESAVDSNERRVVSTLCRVLGCTRDQLCARIELIEPHPLVASIEQIPAGTVGWSRFQDWVTDSLNYLFVPPLEPALTEVRDRTGDNRRDIVLANRVRAGFWGACRVDYEAHYVIVDAKNSSKRLGKDSVLQMANYLKPHGAGRLGLVVCRKGFGPAAERLQYERWAADRILVLPVCVSDLVEMINVKDSGREPESTLQALLDDFRLSL